MSTLVAEDSLASDDSSSHAIRVRVILRTTARVYKFGADFQVLQIVSLGFHIFFQVGKKLGQCAIGQTLDDILLLIEVKRGLPVAQFASLVVCHGHFFLVVQLKLVSLAMHMILLLFALTSAFSNILSDAAPFLRI